MVSPFTCPPNIVFSETFIPPIPIKKRFYRCDKLFHIEDIQKLYESHEKDGIVCIQGENFEIGYKECTKVVKLTDYHFRRTRRHNKGGQSSLRFARIRENQVSNFIEEIAHAITDSFIDPGEQGGLMVRSVYVFYQSVDIWRQVKKLLPSSILKLLFMESAVLAAELSKVAGNMEDYKNNKVAAEVQRLEELIQVRPEYLVFGPDIARLESLGTLTEIYTTDSERKTRERIQIHLFPKGTILDDYTEIGVSSLPESLYRELDTC